MNELESIFIEIVNPKRWNTIAGVIYRHPFIDLTNFNSSYLNKFSEEQKSIFLLGDFHVNLLNCNDYNSINEFLDSLVSNSRVQFYWPKVWMDQGNGIYILKIMST